MDREQPSYYAIIPANVRYDNELVPNEKILYGEITSLLNKNGECWVTNKYFAELYDVDNRTIARWLRHLKEKGYLDIFILYQGDSKVVDKRVIKITNNNLDTSVIEYSKKTTKSNKFVKPTIEEITEYCKERNNKINPNTFYDYYESQGWKVGKNPMKDWKAYIRTWEKNKYNTSSSNKREQPLPDWANKEIEKEEITSEQQEEMEKLLSEFK